ncbi:hypothetical protein [Myxococcus vastator]|uniref:hypothetical protein n=1 Tax=Myxococcus vastator TaxID=2709664 RepID=UPI0019677F92|nr:hypothetical protein [Myxococcus vastator]
MKKLLLNIHGTHHVEAKPTPAYLNGVRIGRRVVVGHKLPMKGQNARKPHNLVAKKEHRPKRRRFRKDVFDLPAKLLFHDGAVDLNRRRH